GFGGDEGERGGVEGGGGAAERSHSRATLPPRNPGSTIAEAGLNFRVRNGNGCGPRSVESGKIKGRRPWTIEQRAVLEASSSSALPWARGQASRAISTGQLHALLRFHLRPIDVLVSDGPSGDRSP